MLFRMTTNPFQNYPPGIVTAQIMGKMLNFLSESRYRDLQTPTCAVVIAELFVYVKNKIMALIWILPKVANLLEISDSAFLAMKLFVVVQVKLMYKVKL